MSATEPLPVNDQTPEFQDEILLLHQGLLAERKWISSIYFYDTEGSRLFERITEQPEYYLTRTELEIMRRRGDEIASTIGREAMVIEPGSGAGEKVGLLLRMLRRPVAYVPVEISRNHLEASARVLAREFPAVEVLPVWADFTRPLDLPQPLRPPARRVVYFPGSTLGNFEPEGAVSLLRNFATMLGAGGTVLIGVDLAKNAPVLEAAYNDAAGVTAAFNRNMLTHLNRRFDANFDLMGFEHLAFYNEAEGRIEMHLRSLRDQIVDIAGARVNFVSGETIHTESSYKYTDARFAALVARAGFRLEKTWKDPAGLFSIRYLILEPGYEITV